MASIPVNPSTEESSWKLGFSCSVCLKASHFACWPVCQGVLALVARAVAPDSGTSCALNALVSENAALIERNTALVHENAQVVAQNQQLVSENAALVTRNQALIS